MYPIVSAGGCRSASIKQNYLQPLGFSSDKT